MTTPTQALELAGELIGDLSELAAHFEDRADITDNGGPNFAMKSQQIIERAITALRSYGREREAALEEAAKRCEAIAESSRATDLEMQLRRAESRLEQARAALAKIANWEMPPSGRFWDKEQTDPMSYGAAFGSNGERDYVKSVALAALSPKEQG